MREDTTIIMQYPYDEEGKNRLFDGKQHTIKPIAIRPIQGIYSVSVDKNRHKQLEEQLYVLAYYDVSMKTNCVTIIEKNSLGGVKKIPLNDYKLLNQYLKKKPFTPDERYENQTSIFLPNVIGLEDTLLASQIFYSDGTPIKQKFTYNFDNLSKNQADRNSLSIANPASPPPTPPNFPQKEKNKTETELPERIICVVPYYIDEQQNSYVSDCFFTYQSCSATPDSMSYHYAGIYDKTLKEKILSDFRDFDFPKFKKYHTTTFKLDSTGKKTLEEPHSISYYTTLVPCDSLQKLEAISKANKIIVDIPYSHSEFDATNILEEACNGTLPMKTTEALYETPKNGKIAAPNYKTTTFETKSKQYS